MKAAFFTFLVMTLFLFAGGAYAQSLSPSGVGVSEISPPIITGISTHAQAQTRTSNNFNLVAQITDLLQPVNSNFLFNASTIVATAIGLFLMVKPSNVTVARAFGCLLIVGMAALNLMRAAAEAVYSGGCGGGYF
jgi:hypothetical protein